MQFLFVIPFFLIFELDLFSEHLLATFTLLVCAAALWQYINTYLILSVFTCRPISLLAYKKSLYSY
jgi:hypothetical protein